MSDYVQLLLLEARGAAFLWRASRRHAVCSHCVELYAQDCLKHYGLRGRARRVLQLTAQGEARTSTNGWGAAVLELVNAVSHRVEKVSLKRA